MAVNIQIRKFHNQFKNGLNLDTNLAESTHYLLGFVGQKLKRTTELATFWRFEASANNTVAAVTGGKTLTRLVGSWLVDGFQTDDTIEYRSAAIPANNQTNTVTNVTALVMTVDTGWGFTNISIDAIIHGTTRLLGIEYKSNLIENDDPPGYISNVDDISTRKWIGEFTVAEYDAGTEITATPSGLNQSWQMASDLVKMKILQKPLLANDFTQILQVTEIFTITPFFDNIANLEAGIKPDEYIDAASLRSIARYELRITSLNPIVKHVLEDSDNPETDGNVGYYDEHANGFTPVEFTKDSIVYVNVSNEDKIVIDELTSITCTIDSVNNVFSQGNTQFQMNIVFLNEDQDNLDNIDTNFAFDTVFAVADGSTKDGENGVFTNVEGNIVANQLVVTADIQFSPAAQTLIEDGKYIISIATNDHTTAIDQSKLVNVLMDLNDFIKNNDVPDLMAIDTNFFYEHPHDKGTQGKTDFQGWVEDGILMSSDFTLDLSKDAVITSMEIRLMARNSVTDEDFEIANIPLDFTTAIISGGVQQIDIDTERGFQLVEDSQFNFLKVQTGIKVGDIQHYDLDIGFKLQWMDWQALAGADPVFFDNSKLNDGLNRLISNYSALNNYDIVMFVDAVVSNGLLNTNYRFISPGLRTFEYETDDSGSPSTKWVGLVETFDQSANNLNSNLHGSENTELKVTFTPLSGLISETPVYGVMRLEEFQQGGLFNIFELSTFRNAAVNNPLIPKTGENKASFNVFTDRIEVECAVDFTKLNPTSQYKISCRLGTSCNESSGCAWQSENSTVKTTLFGVDFFNESIGIAVGLGGRILKTTDGGVTWVSKPSGTAAALSGVIFADADTVYVCGRAGLVIKSTDGGDTWVDKSVGILPDLLSVHFISTTTGWVCGLTGTIQKTTDGGDNWVSQDITAGALLSIFFIDANVGWVCGQDGEVFKSTDGGTNFSAQVSGTPDLLNEVFFIDANKGWMVGGFDQILLTTDGGTNWNIIALPVSNNNVMRSISFFDADNGITCGDGGSMFRSTDGGNTWVQESTGTVKILLDAEILSETSAYAVGIDGEIIRYVCTVGCNILDDGKLKEDGTQKLTEDGNNKIKE